MMINQERLSDSILRVLRKPACIDYKCEGCQLLKLVSVMDILQGYIRGVTFDTPISPEIMCNFLITTGIEIGIQYQKSEDRAIERETHSQVHES